MSVKDLKLERFNSHSVRIDFASDLGRYDVSKEEVYGYFRATWRGVPVVFTMSADRYRHSSGISEWRIYCTDAREIDPALAEDVYGRGPAVSDTARQRLGAAARPVVEQWLASADYVTSRRTAFARALEHEASQLGTHQSTTSRLRTYLETFASELEPADAKRLAAATDAYEAFLEILSNR